MSREPVRVPIDVRLGPNLTCVLRVLDAIDGAVRVIPDDRAAEIRELLEAGLQLKSLCARELRERKP